MATVTVRGVRFGCEERGQGRPAFVFIHGWACDRTVWAPQLDDLSRDFRCLAVDLRGRGESEAVPPYDIGTAADDVAELIRTFELAPVIAVGHSLGGLVALLLNRRHPELVCGIVLGDSPLTAAAQGFERTITAIRAAGGMEPVRGFVESFFSEATPSAVRQAVLDLMLSCPADVAAGMLEEAAFLRTELPSLLREADEKPFMAIWAARPLGDPSKLRELTRFVRQELVPAGHFFQLEQPAMTNALLRAFVDDVRRDPRLERRGIVV